MPRLGRITGVEGQSTMFFMDVGHGMQVTTKGTDDKRKRGGILVNKPATAPYVDQLEVRAAMTARLAMAMIVSSSCCRPFGLPALTPVGYVSEGRGADPEREKELELHIAEHRYEITMGMLAAGITGFTNPDVAVPALLALAPARLEAMFAAVVASATIVIGDGGADLAAMIRKEHENDG